MDSLPELVVLRLMHSDQDAVVDVVVERRNVLPTKNHLRVHRTGGPGDEIGTSQHGEVVQDAQGPVHSESVVVQKGCVIGDLGEEKPFQDGGGNGEGLLDLVLRQTSDTLEYEVEGTVLRRRGNLSDVQHATDSANGTDVLGKRRFGFDSAGGNQPLREKADVVVLDR